MDVNILKLLSAFCHIHLVGTKRDFNRSRGRTTKTKNDEASSFSTHQVTGCV
jgi:hypothetical protein